MSPSSAESKGRLLLEVTVDWEGRVLADENLRAMEAFHSKFPGVKLTHFLNAAYYTKPGAVPDETTRSIRRGLAAGDEFGLHVHGWRRLFEASGVAFRTSPTFWGTDTLRGDCAVDCGHEVALGAYTQEELEKVFRFSLDTLKQNGFGAIDTFRCGGWMAEPQVLLALAKQGIRSDHSAVPAKFLESEIGKLALYGWVDRLWTNTNERSQPYTIRLGASGLSIGEVPDNGALADYMLPSEMIEVYEANKRAFLADPSRDVVVSIGFHQETAAKFAPRVEEALAAIFASSKAEKITLVSVTAKEISTKVGPNRAPPVAVLRIPPASPASSVAPP